MRDDRPPLTPDEAAELAALYVAGALGGDDARAFEARLSDGEPAPVQEVASLRGVLDDLVTDIEPVAPPTEARARLLDAVAAEGAAPRFFAQRADQGEWVDLPVPGLSTRVLFEDRARGLRTSLLRLEPGAVIPRHVHPAVEECYVLEGDIETDGQWFGVGDYVRYAAGTTHESVSSRSGCLLLLNYGVEQE